ncbi:hypothetical protein AURDEDRAFT_113635 [Auricularia subglabra TFB-10046 SS5]|nr:hypothetical protein AURDEDRAFT_113635 [Auricularia subglabra TFB-10046 SS5]
MRLNIALVLAALLSAAHGHGVITKVAGANGKTGAGFGVLADTPRDGSRARPFQQDTSIIRDREIARGTASPCGRTKAGGVNDIASSLAAAVADGLPTADADGQVGMTLHQVNQDGAGPYTCEVSADGSGEDFRAMDVVKQVPGVLALSLATAQDFPLVAQMPAGTACSGGPNGDACIVRCRNGALAGPFGGCVAVTTGDSGKANATAKSPTSATTATDAAAATNPPNADASDADIAAAEAAEAARDENDERAPKKGKGAAGLAGILRGALGGNKKRMFSSRVAARARAGRWIAA